MKKENLVYSEFLNHYEHENIYIEKYYAFLVSSKYIPNKDHTLKDILPYEIRSENYQTHGKEIIIKKVSEIAAAVDGAYITWEKITPYEKYGEDRSDIRYLIIYSKDFYGNLTMVMCQDFQENVVLENDDLRITWNRFFLQFIPSFGEDSIDGTDEEGNSEKPDSDNPNKPDSGGGGTNPDEKPEKEDRNAILNECILGWMKLGYNHDGYEVNW